MAGEDRPFVAWVRTLPCAARLHGICRGRIEAHHAGSRGLGQKAHDRTCIPLCTGHHRAWHDLGLPFREWTREGRISWRDEIIAATQTLYLETYGPYGAT